MNQTRISFPDFFFEKKYLFQPRAATSYLHTQFLWVFIPEWIPDQCQLLVRERALQCVCVCVCACVCACVSVKFNFWVAVGRFMAHREMIER